jgi:hypothetical protein
MKNQVIGTGKMGYLEDFSKWSRSKTRKRENAGRWLRKQTAWEPVVNPRLCAAE